MLRILIINYLISFSFLLKIEKVKSDFYLISNISNTITPFSLKSENQYDVDNKYTLKTICSDDYKIILNPTSLSSLICQERDLEMDFEKMNIFLGNLNVKPIEKKRDIININYELIFKNQQNEIQSFKIKQSLKIISFLPIIKKTEKIVLEGSSEFMIEISEIDQRLFTKDIIFNFKVIFNPQIPYWLNYKFYGNSLFFYGDFPKKNTSINISYVIQDNLTQLMSEHHIVLIKEKKERTYTTIKNIFFLIFCILLTILATIILTTYFVIKKKKEKLLKKKQLQESMEKNIKANVLGDSISSQNSERFYMKEEEKKNQKFCIDFNSSTVVFKRVGEEQKNTLHNQNNIFKENEKNLKEGYKKKFKSDNVKFKKITENSFSDIANDSREYPSFTEGTPFGN